jgi:outer membrane protein OmpA-like peptidoglycan-associated protein
MRTLRQSLALVAAGTALLGASPAALAQSGGIALEQLDPAPAGDAFFGVQSPSVSGHLVPRAFAMFDYALKPLSLRDSNGNAVGAIVSGQAILRADVSLALWNRILLDADVPFTVAQSGDNPTLDGISVGSPSKAEMGDIRFLLRARLLGDYYSPFQLGLGGELWVPSGPTASYGAEGAVRGGPQLLLGGRMSQFVWSANGGLVLRGSENPHTLTYGAAAGLVLGQDDLFQIGPEIYGATGISSGGAFVAQGAAGSLQSADKTNLEVLLGAKLRVAKVLVAGVAGGPGLTHAPGTPVARFIGMLGYAPEPARVLEDRDHDGIPDENDACPDVPGKPSEDPKLNGCPPPDRDHDGIIDAQDACPDVAGVPNADPKKNGCPPDTDGDGIPDAQDACPTEKGVASPDPKKNGCPPDSDGDGIPDAVDACPNEKGVASSDPKLNGCPADSDGDGIPDAVDACPHEKGPADPDPKKNGCPREVRVTATEIVILKQVQFLFGKAGITQTVDPVSDDLLTQVRDVLQEHPEIKKIEVQGYTDNVGQEKFNQKLSQDRADAVRQWLIQHGIPAEKLSAKGYGSQSPIADNKTPEGRQKNRRVQFKITEKSQ